MNSALRLILVLLALSAGAARAMTIDGEPNEPEWAQAQVFTDFRVTEPQTLEPAPRATTLRILALPDALYASMRSELAPELRTHGHSQRDAPILDADPAILFIDFEGQGKTAYEFTVSLSGSKRDSIILNQSELSRDWDANWDAAVHEDATGWTAEWRIPWSVAPDGSTRGSTRTLGIAAARYIKREAHRYSFPAVLQLSANFVRSFQRIEVPRYSTATLDWFPYLSLTRDTLENSSRGHAGVDVFWKPNGRHQLSASLNPDFGQVESDDLIVNFSAVETLLQEKRPFFTQGLQLFDLRTTREGRLVNTRRIGASPDLGSELISNVRAAAKYTGIHGGHEYGFFGATEEDSREAQGRSYLTGRWRYAAEGYSFGYLGTAALRPTLARDAYVHAIDYNRRLPGGMALSAQALMSDIRSGAASANPGVSRGYGAWARLDYQPGGLWQHIASATWYDRNLDINDLGYQERANIMELELESHYFVNQYRPGAPAASGSWIQNFTLPYSPRGLRQVATFEFGHDYQWRSGGWTTFLQVLELPGYDDLMTRGHNNLRMPARHNWIIEHESAIHGRFRYSGKLLLHEEGFTDLTRELIFEPKCFVTDAFSVGLNLDLAYSPNWLLWVRDSRVAVYRRHEFNVGLNANWYPSARQELRVKLQWLGLGAKAVQAYELATDGSALPVAGLPNDFTVSTLGAQLRYRYEFRPQSDFYAVYSRGGDGSLEDATESLGAQFRRAVNQTNTSQFFVKVRYRM
jgi:hypothetical protein